MYLSIAGLISTGTALLSTSALYFYSKGRNSRILISLGAFTITLWTVAAIAAKDPLHAMEAVKAGSTALVLVGVVFETADQIDSLFIWISRKEPRIKDNNYKERIKYFGRAGAALLIYGLFSELYFLPIIEVDQSSRVFITIDAAIILLMTFAVMLVLAFSIRNRLPSNISRGSPLSEALGEPSTVPSEAPPPLLVK